MRPRRLVPVVLSGALVLAGCASGGFGETSTQRDLVKSGLTRKQATCITNGMLDNFDPTRLGARTDPSAKELAKQRTILTNCGVTPRKP